jgi:hypothetical protein
MRPGMEAATGFMIDGEKNVKRDDVVYGKK